MTRRVKTLLEGSIGQVAVIGEVSNLKTSPSGHVYFCLKDSLAVVDCVVWRSAASRLGCLPADGVKITARGKLTVYEPRGRYQLVVTSLVAEADKGDLWRRFEELKERLAEAGLFAPERKRPLPENPKTLGIVTSPTGAALRDMLKILARRAPNLKIVVSPCLVQGREAETDIPRALDLLDKWGGADVIVVGRGGGALEDLWAFNSESVALAIARANTPVVSAVGHETDFTIADFVADARAATPSEAAECVAPDRSHMRGRIAHAAIVLSRALSGMVRERRERLSGLVRASVFRRPLDQFMPRWQRLDDAFDDMKQAFGSKMRGLENRVELAETKIRGFSPLGVLERGYAVVLDKNGRAVTDAAATEKGDLVTAVLHRGRIGAVVRTQEIPDKD